MPLTVCVYLRSNFFLVGAARLFYLYLFLQDWRFSRSRSSKVTDIGANRKRICDFLLVRNSNFDPILHRFGDRTGFMCSWPHPCSNRTLGVFLLHQIADVERQRAHGLKLFGREIIFEEFQLMWSRYLIVTDRQMDSQTDRWHAKLQSHNHALH